MKRKNGNKLPSTLKRMLPYNWKPGLSGGQITYLAYCGPVVLNFPNAANLYCSFSYCSETHPQPDSHKRKRSLLKEH